MKKQFKNLLFATILVAASTTVHAQWFTTGNTAVAGDKLGTLNAIDLRIVTNGVPRMTVKKNTGFVGIGTTTPGNKLEVAGGDAKINGITVGLGGGFIAVNTALGYSALASNTSGANNTASGYNALHSNTTGYNNVANGFVALAGNTTGYLNTASGAWALVSNTTGSNNTANGHSALFTNNMGYNNTANGASALYQNTTGDNNTANGTYALINNITGFANTADGASALYTNTSGSYNTGLGNGADVNAGNLTNATAIGANAIVSASNTMQLGSTGTVVFANGGMVAIVSDKRFKDDIKENDAPGLEFINKLRPVSYKFNYKRLDDFIRKDMDASKNKTDAAYQQQLIEKGKQREVGFIAQEVEKTVKDNGYTFNGVYAPQNSNDHYGLDYSKFVVPLVKSVQQLSKENDDLKAQLLALNTRLEALENKSASSSQNNAQINTGSNSYLYQIAPNPFSQKATISFKLPSSASNAQLLITDAAGNTIKTYMLTTGSAQQDIYANDLTAGVYHYSLVINGKIIDSKQMVITK